MDLIIINILIVLVGTAIAAYWDHKTGIVPDKLSHSMIILGAILVPLTFPGQILTVYAVGAIVFGLGFLLYSFGQLGGGDVKLFTAIALLIPFYPDLLFRTFSSIGIEPVVAIYPFIGSVFVFAGIIGPMFISSIRFHLKIRGKKREVENYRGKLFKGLILSLLVVPLAVFWSAFSLGFLVLLVPMAITLPLIPFKRDVVRLFFSKTKSLQDLNDDDVLALEEVSEEKKKDLGLWRKTFTPPEIRKIKKKAEEKGYEEIKVCEGMTRFVPYIFVSLLANLIVGDVFLFLIKISMV